MGGPLHMSAVTLWKWNLKKSLVSKSFRTSDSSLTVGGWARSGFTALKDPFWSGTCSLVQTTTQELSTPFMPRWSKFSTSIA